MPSVFPRLARTINYGQPVNWDNPVNRGLQLWWLPLPQMMGTLTVWDLCGRVPGALVNGMAWAGSKGMPYGAWQSDADARINGTVTLLPDVAQTFTIMGWFRFDAALGTTIFTQNNRWRIQRSGGNLCLTVTGGSDNQFTTLPISNALQWYFFSVSLTGTSAVGYLDGVSESLTITAPSSGSNSFYVGDNDFGSFGVAGLMTDFRLYNRVVPTGELAVIRAEGRRGHQNTLNWLTRRWFTPGPAAAGTYTASAALSVGPATISASAAFTPPTYTGSAALTVGPTTFSGSATFTAPVYTGTAALTAGPATFSGSATFTAPVYTGSAALTVGPATFSASGTFTAPTYTGSAALTVGPAAFSGSATFTAPVYTGSAALTVGPATLSASGTFVAPVYTASAAVTVGPATFAGSAVFATAVYQGTAALTAGPATLSGSATFAAGTFTATADLTVGPATLSASSSFTGPIYDGTTANLVVGPATFTGSATSTGVTYTGTMAVTIGPATLSGSATFSGGTKTATADLTVGPATFAGSAQVTNPAYTASAALLVGAAYISGTAFVSLIPGPYYFDSIGFFTAGLVVGQGVEAE